MSRIRYIKPGFFVDDDLAECQPLARILFAGLWTIADREGRLEDRPRRIRAELLPNEDVNTDALLQELADHGRLIVRYEVDGHRYIAIPGFLKHQKPHARELPSTIPEPAEHDLGSAQASPRQCPSTTQADLARARNGDLDLNGDGDGDGVRALSGQDAPDVLCGDVVSESEDKFTLFWAAYPRKEARKRAARLWSRMTGDDRGRALAACRHYGAWAAEHPDGVLMIPTTFLSIDGRRWEDWEAGPPPGRDRAPQRSGRAVDSAFGAIREVYKSMRGSCPNCEADLTVDEDGEHCPACSWRASPTSEGQP